VSEPTTAGGAMPEGWTLPAVTPFNRDWFTSGEIAIQTCAACGTLQHPPEEICHVCGSMAFASTVLPGTGTVYSYTVVHHSVAGALDAAVPYTVVLVSLDAAPDLRVVGNLVDGEAQDVAIGMPVTATWMERIAEDATTVLLPQWQRVKERP
jgi:uncharacterized OB-fold protein